MDYVEINWSVDKAADFSTLCPLGASTSIGTQTGIDKRLALMRRINVAEELDHFTAERRAAKMAICVLILLSLMFLLILILLVTGVIPFCNL